MLRGGAVATSALVMAVAALIGQGAAQMPAALEQMVATERAFAAMGAEKGPRESFLAYFADEAVTLDGARPRPAKEEIREWPAPAPGARLLWEPRTGDIASSGDLGYLTGPVVRVAPDGTRRHACYMSVWKKQGDGRFKVVMDFGITAPQAVPFAKGFTRSWNVLRYHDTTTAPADLASLKAAEHRIAAEGRTSPGAALASRATDQSRVYRDGAMPLLGKAAIDEGLRGQPPVLWTADHVETAKAGDLGYAWGRFTTQAPGTREARGYYVRVWGRGADGVWRVLMDVAQVVG